MEHLVGQRIFEGYIPRRLAFGKNELAWFIGDDGLDGTRCHGCEPAVFSAVGMSDQYRRASLPQQGGGCVAHVRQIFCCARFLPRIEGLLAEELVNGGWGGRETHARIQGCLLSWNPDAVAEGIPDAALAGRGRVGARVASGGRSVPGPAAARLINDIQRPVAPRQEGLKPFASVRRGFPASAGLPHAVPQNQRVVTGLLRDVKLSITVIPVKGIPVLPLDYRTAEQQAAHGFQGDGLLLLTRRHAAGRKRRCKRQGKEEGGADNCDTLSGSVFRTASRRMRVDVDRILSVCAGVRKHMKTHRHISSFVFERYCLHGRFLVVSFGYEELFALSVLLVFEHGWQAVCTSVSVRPCFTVCIG